MVALRSALAFALLTPSAAEVSKEACNWVQYLGDNSKCGGVANGATGIAATNEAACQKAAEDAGHQFFQFTNDLNGGHCDTINDCDTPTIGTTFDWKIFQCQVQFENAEAKEAKGAACFFDSAQATTFLAQAGTSVDQSTRDCVKAGIESDPKGEAVCAADVGNILKSFAFTTSFLASAINSCGMFSGAKPDVKAQCTADITGLVGAISAIEMGGSGIEAFCNPDGKGPYRAAETAGQHVDGRASLDNPLQADKYNPNPATQNYKQRHYTATTAYCVIYSAQSTWFLARAGLNINAAAEACEDKANNEAMCAATASAVVSSFSAAVSYISGAAETCAHSIKVPGAACAAHISMVTAGMAGIAAAGASVSKSCTEAIGGSSYWPAQESPSGARRLQDAFGSTSTADWKAMLEQWNSTSFQSPPLVV